jgi:hypothetical protein
MASIGLYAPQVEKRGDLLIAALVLFIGMIVARADAPVPDMPFVNSMGMKFVPAGTTGVLFCIWDVRVKDYQEFMDETGHDMQGQTISLRKGIMGGHHDIWSNPGFSPTPNDPVVGISGIDITAFVQWLTKKEQDNGTITPAQAYRVPTKVEWLTAAGTTQFPWGDTWPPPKGAGNFAGSEARDSDWAPSDPVIPNYDDGFPRTSPVASFNPNAYGLYDMGGNVRQICCDETQWYYMGSSWYTGGMDKLSLAYSASSRAAPHVTRLSDLGFRIVLAASAAAPAPPTTPAAVLQTPASPVPAQIPTPVIPAPSVTSLTAAQARAVVLIQGDNAEGTGFLIKTADGPVVVTNLHVLANNPNLKITTNTGAIIPVLSMRGAADRDLAELAIKDAEYSYLDVAPDISQTIQPGDEVITPGNSEGGEVVLNTTGKILGIGPERIEIDNPIYHGNSGGPIFHTKSGKVVGVVTEAVKVDTSDELDKTSFASRNSAITAGMRYFGLRLDTVPSWLPVDAQRFQTETTFLDQFDKANHALDSYLNAPNDDKPEDNTWRNNPDIVKANTSYFGQANGGDAATQMDALRQWLADMYDIANINMDAIQNPRNFYSFDQEEARNDIEFRKALKTELDGQSANLSQLASLPRKNN